MRILGVDFGKSRTGLALGDTETAMAFPLSVIEEADVQRLTQRVAKVAHEEGCERVVVGRPARITGHAAVGEIEAAAQEFAAALHEATGLEVDMEDERLSTAYAERLKREAGKSVKIGADAIAAAAILETYLNRHAADSQ